MKSSNRVSAFAAVLATILTAALVTSTVGQVKQGEKRPMKTKYFMKGIIKPHTGALKKALESAPADDEAWEELAMHAAILNEGSYVLMADGRCPDSVWADAVTKSLRSGSEALIKAIDGKNLDAARTAFKELSGSCKACHEKHKE